MEKSMKEQFLDLLTKQGVYGKIKNISPSDSSNLISRCFHSLDLYCPTCKANKTFVHSHTSCLNPSGQYVTNYCPSDSLYIFYYLCPTCTAAVRYVMYKGENELVKIGQYPSVYDIDRDELKQYQNNSLVDKSDFEQIYKAEICASAGYFVAAYTYMRRIYEALLLSVFEKNKTSIGISDIEFRKLRSDEKIAHIKPYLALGEDVYKPLYAILSAGIHSLTEEECGEDYNLLKIILLDILAAQKAQREKEENHKKVLELYSMKKKDLK